MSVLVLLLLGALTSAAVSWGSLQVVVGALIGAAALIVGVYNWRWSVYGLVGYMPFSGIPILLGLPTVGTAVLLKDLLFIVPAYTGYLLGRRRQGLTWPGSALYLLLAGLALLVAMESIQTIRQPLIPAVGAKVWLMYIPMMFMGYQLICNYHDLSRLLGLMTVLALVPACIGIIEAGLLDTGRSDLVYGWYGAAARAATQNYVGFDYTSSTGRLLRVPSLFSSVFQYYDFVAVMSAISYGWWQLTRRRIAFAAWLIILLACFLSGARSAFVLTPMMMGITLLLSRRILQATALISVVCGGLIIATGLIGLNAEDLVTNALDVGAKEVSQGFFEGAPTALHLSLMGMGTGVDTNGARYVVEDGSSIVLGVNYSESWFVKVIVELGAAGMLLFSLLFGWILLRAYYGHRLLSDARLRAVSAGLIAFTIWGLVYSFKGIQLDLDPVNVYFWFLAGLLLKIPALSGQVDGLVGMSGMQTGGSSASSGLIG